MPDPVLIIGGGAAGFFAAIACAEKNPKQPVILLEKGKAVLQKVKVSGGGRCNLTHACFQPEELVKNYPRGGAELLAPFRRFGPADTVKWFEKRGVKLKTEADGRMFPASDRSQTIIDCLWNAAKNAGVKILTRQNVISILPPHTGQKTWEVKTQNGETYLAKKLMIATGGSPRVWEILKKLGHRIVPPVPSLFTFNIKDERIAGLAGISVPEAEVKILGTALSATGPLLITHWGMSGPVILKLSAWAARVLHEVRYEFEIEVNWMKGETRHSISEKIRQVAEGNAKKQIGGFSPFGQIPKRFWEKFLAAAEIDPTLHLGQLSKKKRLALATHLSVGKFKVKGKSTFKEEFVTAGGVDLEEVNMGNFESKIHPGLHLAGEVLNIDAVTGGFNFQAAWTGGFLVASG